VGDRPQVEAGLYEFLSTRFHAHEPMYFVYGGPDPDTKFQISLKYQLFSASAPIARTAPFAADLYLAYSQTSFWDIDGTSSPFVDTSYRPELMYQIGPKAAQWLPGMSRFDLQAGLKHESNGKAGVDSRTINTAYVSPILTFGNDGRQADIDRNQFFISLAPRVWMYLTDMEDNPDIYHYRGYGDIKLVAGWRGGFQAALVGSVGNDWDKGALQVDLTYPLQKLAIRDLGMYLDAQFFTGFGENLLGYNESRTAFRMGLSLVR
jgi:phospholipase A1/A2